MRENRVKQVANSGGTKYSVYEILGDEAKPLSARKKRHGSNDLPGPIPAIVTPTPLRDLLTSGKTLEIAIQPIMASTGESSRPEKHQAKDILRHAFAKNPQPSDSQLLKLAKQCGRSVTVVSKW